MNQGPLKNSGMMNDLFEGIEKVAITGTDELAGLNPNQNPNPAQDRMQGELNNTMQSGGLNHGGMADQLESDRGGMNEPTRPESSITPSGQERGTSPFLSDSGEMLDEDEAMKNQGLLHERGRIQQVLQGAGFVMEMNSAAKDGTIQLKLRPQPGLQITPDRYEQLLQSLGRVGINPTAITDPDPSTGAFSINYKTNTAPEKITKAK